MKYMNAEFSRLKDYVRSNEHTLRERFGSEKLIITQGKIVPIGSNTETHTQKILDNSPSGFYFIGTIDGFLNEKESDI
jgi:hypothetical protein